MTITERINEIIDRRLGRGHWANNGRLQQIERAEHRLSDIRNKVESLKELMSQIEYQKQEHRGEYYTLLQKDFQMEEKLKEVDTNGAVTSINNLQSEFNLLKKRFSRESVQIAMIGRERQGKSTIIQQITNLNNDVIPAFDGSSCTGAVSIIHNYDGPFHVDLTFFERTEFVNIINDKLNRYYPGKGFYISSPEQIPSLQARLDSVMNKDKDAMKFKHDYIDHYTDYNNLVGAAPTTLNDESVVAQYVAQYQLFKEQKQAPDGYEVVETPTKDGKSVLYKAIYYKYLAVKTANIFKRFEYADSGKLVLVDTIGIGPKDDGSIRKQMFNVVREECDGVIDIFRPDTLGNSIDDKQQEILEGVTREFSDRMVDKWFVYVINEVQEGDGRNMHLTPQLLEEAQQMANGEKTKFAWAVKVNGKDQKDVINNLVIPQLNLITKNLDDIDDCMLKTAQQKADALYNEYSMLCKCVNAVLSSSIKTNQNIVHLFDGLYKNVQFSAAMKRLDDSMFKEQDKPCMEIAAKLKDITEESIFDALPDQERITSAVEQGIKTVPEIFINEIDEFRNRIFDIYENVNVENLHPLQEGVRMQMIELLYNEGMLKNIPLTSYNVSDGPSIQWLKALVEETMNAESYPQVYGAMRLILDYQINIEGLIEYNVARSVHIINTMYPEFYQMPFTPLPTTDSREQSDHIFHEIFNRITHIQERMRKWINDFAMIPSHSFYARVHKVREKLFLSTEGNEQLRYYYLDNSRYIWSEEINSIAQVENAFGGWNAMCKDLNTLLDKKYFEI